MKKEIKAASIAGIVYIITWMWILQSESVEWWARMLLAFGFFVTVLATYGMNSD